jgi:conjugative relaxase-like TrwC/TraI family protein
MITVRCMTDGATYLSRHLCHSDYYDEQRRVQGKWLGLGAERLGLKAGSAVDAEVFDQLRQNINPVTGERLTMRTNTVRRGSGREVSNRRCFYDVTISAPKSVSIMAKVAGDERLVAAHHHAARYALAEAERAAQVQVSLGRAKGRRFTGNLIAAEFGHDTSRSLDPQLHNHYVVMPATWNEERQKWMALEAREIYEQTKYLTEIYRNELAKEVGRLGYEIERREHGWEIKGVEPLERFSQRSAVRDAAVAAEEKKLGRKLTNDERAVVVRETRADKLTEISTAEVRALQRARLSPDEFAALQKVRAAAVVARPVQMESPKKVLALAAEHCFERRTVVQEHELLASALRFGYGRLNVSVLKQSLKTDAAYLKANGKVTTAASLQREQDVVEFVASTRGKFAALGMPVKNDRLSTEQAQAVANVLSCRDQAVVLRGAAGVGKTTALASIIEGSKDEVLVFAPTTKAVAVLQKDGGASRAGQALAKTQTVQALLQSPRLRADCRNKVVVVDEYSMLSLRQLHELAELAQRQNARLIFSGDSRQHLSVEAGDAARIVERETPVRVVDLKTIRRQVPAKYRAAVQSLADGRTAKGLKQLDAIGAIVEVTDRDARHARMVDDYLSASAETKTIETRHGKKAQRKDCAMIAPTWAEIDDLTAIVRDRLKQSGELQPKGAKFTALKNLDWTVAERKDLRKFRGGEVLVFHRPAAGFAKGEEVRALSLRKGKLEVQRADGRVVAVTGKQAGSFAVFKEKQIELCPGDKLRLQTPCVDERGRKLANGAVVTLDGVTADGKLKLADGRTIATRQLTHGYAMTSHGAQGVTCDKAFVAGVMSKQGLYVSASRGRESVTFYTPDKAEFVGDMNLRSEERQSALEFSREAKLQLAFAPSRLTLLRKALESGLDDPRSLAAGLIRQAGQFAERVLKRERHQSLKL